MVRRGRRTWCKCDPAFAGARFLYELGEIGSFAMFNISVLGLPSKDVPLFGLGMR